MDNRKIVVASYVVTSIAVWFLARHAIYWLHQTFYQIRKLPGVGAAREVAPVLLAAVAFAILMRHPKVNTVLDEVVSELKKVTWPSREDVVRSTTVVVICILISSFLIAGLDMVWGWVVGQLL